MKNKIFSLLLGLILIGGIAQASSPYLGGSFGVTSVLPGVTASSAGKAEDAAHSTGDVGTAFWGIVETTNGGTSSTDGDYAGLTLNSLGALRTSATPQSQEGWSLYSNIDIDETSGTTTQQLKATAGVLHGCSISNNTASTVEYVKFYNAASLTGSAAGTETPVMTVPIAGATTIQLNSIDYYFDTGMTLAATTGVAVADTGAPAANAIVVNCTFK